MSIFCYINATMPKNRIRYDSIYRAREMYAVLIEKNRESRSYTKKEMLAELTDKDLYSEFLKTCPEQSELIEKIDALHLADKI